MSTNRNLLAAFTAASCLLSGCSLVGYGIGNVIDSRSHETKWVGGSAMSDIEHVDTTTIRMRDGTLLSGVSLQPAYLPPTMYSQQYEQVVESRDLHLPGLYDTVEVVRVRGTAAERIVVAPFGGFVVDTQTLRPAIRVMRDSGVKVVSLATVESISDRRGRKWEGDSLKTEWQQLPVDRAWRLHLGGADTLLAATEVDSLRIKTDDGLRWVGLGVGIAIDVAMILAAVAWSDLEFDFSGLNQSR